LKFTATLKEDKNCYASLAQREIIVELIKHNILKDDFFLTGGTALSVFYLHHRRSNDLDFFTLKPIDLSEIDVDDFFNFYQHTINWIYRKIENQ
jgi:predicted nucleotidyltransferase component of viral defense system